MIALRSRVRRGLRGRFEMLAQPLFPGTKAYPSETQVKRRLRIVGGNKKLIEKLGRNDPRVCGSELRFKRCCMQSGCF